MPYFTWKGVDIEGRMHKGKLFAQSTQELDALLLKQEIALLHSAPVRYMKVFGSISLDDRIQFFKQLADLLNSGVLLPDALLVIASQMRHAQFQEVISHIIQEVYSGKALSQALNNHTLIFDQVMMQMVKVGEESGKLGATLTLLTDYLQMRSDFGRSLRSALLVPMITICFFFCISLFIFICIVPQFAAMFQSVHQDLPRVTQVMLNISDFMQSQGMVYLMGIISLFLFIIYRLLKAEKGRNIRDVLVINIPLIGTLIRQKSLGYFLHAVSMLLQGGMPLLQAIKVAKATVHNSFLSDNLKSIEQDIEAGSSLSQAMIYNMVQIFDAQVIAIVRVGEESGRLAPLLARAASVYQAIVQRTLTWIVTMINPLVMIILGILITFLIMAVYIPIFNLSNIV